MNKYQIKYQRGVSYLALWFRTKLYHLCFIKKGTDNSVAESLWMSIHDWWILQPNKRYHLLSGTQVTLNRLVVGSKKKSLKKDWATITLHSTVLQETQTHLGKLHEIKNSLTIKYKLWASDYCKLEHFVNRLIFKSAYDIIIFFCLLVI